MDEKLVETVEKLVTGIFASKEEETMRQKTQEALQASADKLVALKEELAVASTSLESVTAEVTSLTEALEAAKVEKEALVAEKAAEVLSLTEAKVSVEAELEKVSFELSTMKKEITADKRMEELASVGVVREDASLQKAKIMDMTDEVFASYKEELVSIKTQVLASLKTVPVEEEKENVPPAKVDPEQSAQAALNLESSPSQSLTAKYQELGLAMAAAINKK